MRLWNVYTCCCVAIFAGDRGHQGEVRDFMMMSLFMFTLCLISISVVAVLWACNLLFLINPRSRFVSCHDIILPSSTVAIATPLDGRVYHPWNTLRHRETKICFQKGAFVGRAFDGQLLRVQRHGQLRQGRRNEEYFTTFSTPSALSVAHWMTAFCSARLRLRTVMDNRRKGVCGVCVCVWGGCQL